MGQKLIKIAQKIALFLYIFRICSLKIFAGGGLGGHGPQYSRKRSTGQKTVRMTRQSL